MSNTMKYSDDLFEIVANYTYDWETWFSEDGNVRWINPAVERMTGYSIEDCLAMDDYPASLIHKADRANIRSLLKSAKSGSSGNDVEFQFVRKDGSTGWAAVSWQRVNDETGGEFGFRTSVREITERKRAEDSLKSAKSEAERANLAKTRFLAAVSHDLRQPLQAMSMYVGALRHCDLGEDGEDILHDMGLCLNNCNELLDDLVDISRLDAGVVVPETRSIAVADILETVERSMRVEAQRLGLDLRIVPSSGFVRCDPAMLTRIMQNLVSNAIRYTSDGRVLVGCRRRGDQIALEVWDTGIGIREDKLDQVFEEFYQIGNLQRDRRRGVGLGLAIVGRLTDLMGASLDVRSTLGKGSTFSVSLPVDDHACAPAAPIATDRSTRRLENTKLLVIDDEPRQLRALKVMLAANGADVIAAQASDAAITQLSKCGEVPDLIIADFRLADGITGAQAVEQIRGWLEQPVPGIILTGDTEPQRIAEAKASGYRLLHKPIEADDLIGEILHIRTAGTRT